MEEFFSTLNLPLDASKKEINTAFHLWKQQQQEILQQGNSEKLVSMNLTRMTAIYKKIMFDSNPNFTAPRFVDSKFIKLAESEPVKKIEPVVDQKFSLPKIPMLKLPDPKPIEHVPIPDSKPIQIFKPRSFRHYKQNAKNSIEILSEAAAKKISTPMIACVATIVGIVLGNLLFTYAENAEMEKEVYIRPEKSAETVTEPNQNPKNPGKNQAQFEAIQTLFYFHDSITSKDYQRAYHYLTQDFQSRNNFENWTHGFDKTVTSQVSNVEVAQEMEGRIILTYYLHAEDLDKSLDYVGTALLLLTDEGWRINEIVNLAK